MRWCPTCLTLAFGDQRRSANCLVFIVFECWCWWPHLWLASTKTVNSTLLSNTPQHFLESIISMAPLSRGSCSFRATATRTLPYHCSAHARAIRHFTAGRRLCSEQQQQQQHKKESFGARLRYALNNTRIQWYTIPAAAGIGFLGAIQYFKVTQRENARREEEQREERYQEGGGEEDPKRPRKRKRIRPSGPWSVAWGFAIMSLEFWWNV